jgi:hypothetical protein
MACIFKRRNVSGVLDKECTKFHCSIIPPCFRPSLCPISMNGITKKTRVKITSNSQHGLIDDLDKNINPAIL